MQKYFDSKRNRLIYEKQKATPDFWDKQWDITNLKEAIENGKNNKLITNITKKYIAPSKSKKILEGGCGKGQFVYALDNIGYSAYGIDFAKRTIEKTKKLFPKLNIAYGNVKTLNFPDEYFDGYWSLGVIEHFYDGYNEILIEMLRVLKKKSYLFLTFPYVCPVRKLKAKLNMYNEFDVKIFNQNNFFQFALNSNKVIKDFQKHGFHLLYIQRFGVIEGLNEEIPSLSTILNVPSSSKQLLSKFIKLGLIKLLTPISSHSCLLVFQKK